jgi:hypothetical protein
VLSKGGVSVRFGFMELRLSLRDSKPSGPRGVPVNWGHSDDFSRESGARLGNVVRGDVCEMCAKSNAAEDVESLFEKEGWYLSSSEVGRFLIAASKDEISLKFEWNNKEHTVHFLV